LKFIHINWGSLEKHILLYWVREGKLEASGCFWNLLEALPFDDS